MRKKVRSVKNIAFIIFMLLAAKLQAYEVFKGYDPGSNKPAVYSVSSLMESKHLGSSRWNENYFHDAQFPESGITVFTNIIFSKDFFSGRGCKFHSIITFDDGSRYVFDKEYSQEEISSSGKEFGLSFGGNNRIYIEGKKYRLMIKDGNIDLDLEYKIVNPPNIFGNGMISIDKQSFMAFSEPISGAYVSGKMNYKGREYSLNGRGSVSHDYNSLPPLKTPTKWRSFWLYNDEYSINIHTVILKDGEAIDRVAVFKDGGLYKSFLNTGLKYGDQKLDNATGFRYPQKYYIEHSDKQGDMIKASIECRKITDKIRVFEKLSPVVHSIVTMAVGEMWNYRFWAKGDFEIKTDGITERIAISGIANFVDTDKR